MTPKHALETLAEAACMSVGIGPYPSEGIAYYIRRGTRIPEFLLPGGLLLRQPPQTREALSRLTSDDARNVPDYAVQVWLLTPEEMKHLPASRHAAWWVEQQWKSLKR